jgi:hypothetical protein
MKLFARHTIRNRLLPSRGSSRVIGLRRLIIGKTMIMEPIKSRLASGGRGEHSTDVTLDRCAESTEGETVVADCGRHL